MTDNKPMTETAGHTGVPELTAHKIADVMRDWLWANSDDEWAKATVEGVGEAAEAVFEAAVNERASLLVRIEQMRSALIEAQKAVKLLEDLTACGADDQYVAALSQQIALALKPEQETA